MKKLSAKSKRGQYFVEAYNKSAWRTLKDAYTKPSAAKQAAFKRCQWICEAENGDNLKVISAGPQFFAVAFEVTTTLGATELRVITKRYNYLITFGDKL